MLSKVDGMGLRQLFEAALYPDVCYDNDYCPDDQTWCCRRRDTCVSCKLVHQTSSSGQCGTPYMGRGFGRLAVEGRRRRGFRG